MALVTHYDLELHQMDVKTAFLNENLENAVYMDQPEGFSLKEKEHMVCKLKLPDNGILSSMILLLHSVLRKTLLIGVYT
jgi:hypothetical protein